MGKKKEYLTILTILLFSLILFLTPVPTYAVSKRKKSKPSPTLSKQLPHPSKSKIKVKKIIRKKTTPSPLPTITSVVNIDNSPSTLTFTCGIKRYCHQMVNCEEAYFYLKNCGLSRLDGDGDGIPCENLCR